MDQKLWGKVLLVPISPQDNKLLPGGRYRTNAKMELLEDFT
jgi:hypothetical protein